LKSGKNAEDITRFDIPFELFYSSDMKKRERGGGKVSLPFLMKRREKGSTLEQNKSLTLGRIRVFRDFYVQ